MAIGPYSAMWLFVSFDLPTLTKEDRRFATRFRNQLLELGFTMFQLSIYSYYVTSKGIADTIANKIQKMVPNNGHVAIIFITDKQFGMIRNFFGEKKIRLEPPEQGLLFE